MERMTIRNSDGSVSQPTDLKWADALKKLAAYEDTGLEPEEVRSAKWIPVTERLPPEDEEINEQARWSEKVIFWHTGCGPRIGWYSHDFNLWSVSGNIMTIRADFVTHWMPLPEPPEGGADG